MQLVAVVGQQTRNNFVYLLTCPHQPSFLLLPV